MCTSGVVYGQCCECSADLMCADLAAMGLCNPCWEAAFEDDDA